MFHLSAIAKSFSISPFPHIPLLGGGGARGGSPPYESNYIDPTEFGITALFTRVDHKVSHFEMEFATLVSPNTYHLPPTT